VVGTDRRSALVCVSCASRLPAAWSGHVSARTSVHLCCLSVNTAAQSYRHLMYRHYVLYVLGLPVVAESPGDPARSLARDCASQH
jgi:hypothetical protein